MASTVLKRIAPPRRRSETGAVLPELTKSESPGALAGACQRVVMPIFNEVESTPSDFSVLRCIIQYNFLC